MSERYDHHRGRAPLLRPAPRRRLAICLGISLGAYAFANAFWMYLATGRWADLRAKAYLADFTAPTRLPDLFERTLNVLSHPWMMPVAGLLLGAVIFTPIAVSVLYRLRLAAPFVLLVAALGHAPAMALALAVACVLASQTTMRSDMPFLAAMLGLLPIGLYLYLFASGGPGALAVLPIQRWVLKTPLVVAVLSAVGAFAAVVQLARLMRYRPGVIAPVLTVLLAGPVTLFYWKIGPDELDYQWIAASLAPGDAVVESADLKTWVARHGAEGLDPPRLLQRAQDQLEDARRRLADRCQRFLEDHPRSDRAPAVAWVLAQTCSLQLDRPALAQGWVAATAEHPAPVPQEEALPGDRRAELQREAMEAAAGAWERLLAEHAHSPQAALAEARLAELELRRAALSGEAEAPARERAAAAYRRLVVAREGIRTALAGGEEPVADDPRGARGRVFRPSAAVPPRGYYQQALHRAERLAWLMATNDVLSDPRAARALGEWLGVNPRGLSQRAHLQQLYDLAGRHEDTPLADNFKLAVALSETDPNRVADQLVLLARLEALGAPGGAATAPAPDRDAGIEAAFALGLLLLRHPALAARGDLPDPAECFRAVASDFANPWRQQASERLRLLEASPPGRRVEFGPRRAEPASSVPPGRRPAVGNSVPALPALASWLRSGGLRRHPSARSAVLR